MYVSFTGFEIFLLHFLTFILINPKQVGLIGTKKVFDKIHAVYANCVFVFKICICVSIIIKKIRDGFLGVFHI